MTDTEQETLLQTLFAPATAHPTSALEADVLGELASICRIHAIDAQELWYKWESYSINMTSGGGQEDLKLTIDSARALKRHVQDELERESRSRASAAGASRRVGGGTPRGGNVGGGGAGGAGDVFGMLDGLTPNTPRVRQSAGANKRKFETPLSKVKAEPRSSPGEFKTPYKPGENGTTASFNDRKNAGQVVEVLNDHIEAAEPPIAPFPEARIKLTANSDLKKLSYKPLAMKASEASEVLDDQIDDFLALIQDHHKLEDSAFGSAESQSTNQIIAVGRIASDTPEGRLNPSSLVLETSRKIGNGRRIPLRVHGLKGFQFFPGQIVALKGINATGNEFTVSSVLEPPLLPSAASPPSTLLAHLDRLKGGPDAMDDDSTPLPLNIIIASGPYTTDDNLDFEPLHALCSLASDNYIDTVILSGPFIDIDHPLIASGDFDLPEDMDTSEAETATMTTVFKHFISPALNTLVSSNPTITILLVPSTKDAISKHVSWPQEPFPRKELSLPKPVRIIGNPMTLSLNEISLGISSQDILTELKSAEVVGGQSKDSSSLLVRLPRYLIEQRNFFPIYPPVERDLLPKTGTADGRPAGAMLDPSFLRLGDMINVRPDLLVVPSALPPFAKVVESVLVINPGLLSKRKGPGTYAKMTVLPRTVSDEERGSAMVAHKLYERARVDIVRI